MSNDLLSNYKYLMHEKSTTGNIDFRADIRLMLEKNINIIDLHHQCISTKSINISVNGLMIILENNSSNLLLPNDKIKLQSSWLLGVGTIKHIEEINKFIYLGLHLDKFKYKPSLFIDIQI